MTRVGPDAERESHEPQKLFPNFWFTNEMLFPNRVVRLRPAQPVIPAPTVGDGLILPIEARTVCSRLAKEEGKKGQRGHQTVSWV